MRYSLHRREIEAQRGKEEARSRGTRHLVRNPGNKCEPQGLPIPRLNPRFSSTARSTQKQAGLLSHPPAVGLVSPPELRNPCVILARGLKRTEECLLIMERSTSIGLFQGRTPFVAFAFSLPGTPQPTVPRPSPDQALLPILAPGLNPQYRTHPLARSRSA